MGCDVCERKLKNLFASVEILLVFWKEGRAGGRKGREMMDGVRGAAAVTELLGVEPLPESA